MENPQQIMKNPEQIMLFMRFYTICSDILHDVALFYIILILFYIVLHCLGVC